MHHFQPLRRWFGLCLLLLCACQTKTIAPEIQDNSLQYSSHELLNNLKERQKRFQDLKSFVKTSIQSSSSKQTFRQTLLIRNNTMVRLDTLNIFGQPLGVLLVSNSNSLLYDVSNQKVYKGLEVWDILFQMLGTQFDFRKYVQIFSGNIPGIESMQVKNEKKLEGSPFVSLSTSNEIGDQIIIEIDPLKMVPTRMEHWKNQKIAYTVQWQDYRTQDEYIFPNKIHINKNTTGEEVSLKYFDPKINQGIPDESFRLNLPGS